MRKVMIQFATHHALCVFPEDHEHLPQAVSELYLNESVPVIVLTGGYILPQHAQTTQIAIQAIAAFAEKNGVLVICGATELGIIGAIAQTRLAHGYRFPLLGITLEKLVSWPGGPQPKRFLWWKKELWPLSTGYSHFILAPGEKFGEDSPWIAEAATYLSRGNKSLTIVINGGNVARKDVALSLQTGRPVVALSGTGRLADEIANDPNKPALTLAVPAEDEQALRKEMENQLQIEEGRVYHDGRSS